MSRANSSPALKPPHRSSPYLAAVALAVLAAIWGYNWVVMKVGIRYCDPFTFAALRGLLGAVALFPIIAVLRRPLRLQAPFLTIAVAILQITGFVGLILWALEQGAAGRTSVLSYTMPFWLLLMAWAFLGEKIRGLQWIAAVLALAGLIFILRPWNLQGTLFSSLLAVAAGFCWAASSVLIKIMQRHHQVDILSLTAWQMFLGSIPLAIVALVTADTPPVWSGSFIAALVYNVLPANALAWWLWLYVLRALPTGTAGVSTLVIPVVGVVSAWIQLGERPTSVEGAGMLLVLAALAVLTLRGLVLSRSAGRQKAISGSPESTETQSASRAGRTHRLLRRLRF